MSLEHSVECQGFVDPRFWGPSGYEPEDGGGGGEGAVDANEAPSPSLTPSLSPVSYEQGTPVLSEVPLYRGTSLMRNWGG